MTGNRMPQACVWLRGTFHVELCKEDGTRQTVATSEWAGSYARVLLKCLLCAPGRRATRSDLIDELWPGDRENADQYLSIASSRLRHIFQNKKIIRRTAEGYELAGPEVLWCDIEECERLLLHAERLMRETEQRGLSQTDAIGLLERACTSFERGGMLEGEVGLWCVALRTQQDKVTRYCHILLAEGYESQGMILHAQRQYQRLFAINPIDEDALCRSFGLLHRQGMMDDLRVWYEEAQRRFEKYEMHLSKTTTKLFEKLMQEPSPLDVYLTPPKDLSRSNESETFWQPDASLAPAWPVTYNRSSQLSTLPRLELLEMLMLSRRRALSNVLNVAFASLGLSRYAFLPQESREYLERVMTHSSSVDGEAIGYLAVITENYWNLRQKGGAIDQLSGITGHFTDITQLLKEARPSPVYEQLCALASENAQLLGRIFSEIREYNLAWNYYTFSMKTAQDINHTDLWASGVARLAELLIRWGEPRNALPHLEAAQKRGIHDPRLRIWLATIEAEIHAMTGNMDMCLRTLMHAKNVTLPESLAHDPYRTKVDPSMIAGYEGACWMRLHKPELALPVLNEAFATYDPASMLRRSLILANTGRVHAQLGDVTKAYKMLLESLDITEQTRSLIAFQRIYQGRAELDPWKKSGDVKELDARIVEVYNSLVKVKERV